MVTLAGLGLLGKSTSLRAIIPRNIINNDEDIFSELDSQVDTYFPKFRTCSQTSFYALNNVFHLEGDQVARSLAAMPGVASRGETCGAVSGSLLAIALVYEESLFDEEGKKSLEPSFRFCELFEKEFGSTRCRDVIFHVTGKRYEITQPEDYNTLRQEGAYVHCADVVKSATHFAASVILEKQET
jgi:C_GCAxxG_C_C family probable redox protein